MKSLSLPNGKVMFWARLDSIFLIQEIHRTQSTHALALHRFFSRHPDRSLRRFEASRGSSSE
jgi:hypothetical protein